MPLDIVNSRFAFLDLETTGLSPWFGDRVCEVAIVLCEGKRIKTSYQRLVNPERELTPWAASTTLLEDSALAKAPFFEQIANEVAGMLKDSIIVCHNAQFALQFLDDEFRRLRREMEWPNVVDTAHLARQYYDLLSYTLPNLAQEFHLPHPKEHRALADALMTRGLFFAMVDGLRGVGKTFDELIGIYNSPAWPDETIQLPLGLAELLLGNKPVELVYVDGENKRTERWVEPLQVLGLSDYLYLRAYCHLRKEERTFRLDRILEVRG